MRLCCCIRPLPWKDSVSVFPLWDYCIDDVQRSVLSQFSFQTRWISCSEVARWFSRSSSGRLVLEQFSNLRLPFDRCSADQVLMIQLGRPEGCIDRHAVDEVVCGNLQEVEDILEASCLKIQSIDSSRHGCIPSLWFRTVSPKHPTLFQTVLQIPCLIYHLHTTSRSFGRTVGYSSSLEDAGAGLRWESSDAGGDLQKALMIILVEVTGNSTLYFLWGALGDDYSETIYRTWSAPSTHSWCHFRTKHKARMAGLGGKRIGEL